MTTSTNDFPAWNNPSWATPSFSLKTLDPELRENVAGVFSIVALSDAALPEIRRCGLSYFPEWFSRWSGIPNPNLFLYLCSVSSSLSTTSLSLPPSVWVAHGKARLPPIDDLHSSGFCRARACCVSRSWCCLSFSGARVLSVIYFFLFLSAIN